MKMPKRNIYWKHSDKQETTKAVLHNYSILTAKHYTITSGIGREVAKQLLLQGWRLGIAGRRLPALEALQSSAPDLIEIAVLDL